LFLLVVFAIGGRGRGRSSNNNSGGRRPEGPFVADDYAATAAAAVV
jgi:hypothetical protein